MGKPIKYVIGIVVVLGVAFFLVTAQQKTLHKPAVTPPPSAPSAP